MKKKKNKPFRDKNLVQARIVCREEIERIENFKQKTNS